jgi:hypothetical protein
MCGSHEGVPVKVPSRYSPVLFQYRPLPTQSTSKKREINETRKHHNSYKHSGDERIVLLIKEKMSAITSWLRGYFENPSTREEKEIARVDEAYKVGLSLIQQRNEPIKREIGATNPVKKAYFADKLEESKEGSRYTFQVTTKANCYESVLYCIEKGDPVREYAD